MSSFKNLVRFSSNGQVHYGDLVEAKDGKYVVRRLDGTLFEDDLIETEEYHTVDTVRSFDEYFPCAYCTNSHLLSS